MEKAQIKEIIFRQIESNKGKIPSCFKPVYLNVDGKTLYHIKSSFNVEIESHGRLKLFGLYLSEVICDRQVIEVSYGLEKTTF